MSAFSNLSIACVPWTATATVLRDNNGNSIASGGNNRVVRGRELENSLRFAASAPLLLHALDRIANLSPLDIFEAGQIARDAIEKATS